MKPEIKEESRHDAPGIPASARNFTTSDSKVLSGMGNLSQYE